MDNRRRMMLASLDNSPLWLFKEGEGFVDGKAIAYTEGSYSNPDGSGVFPDNLHVYFYNSYIHMIHEGGHAVGPRVIIGLSNGGLIKFRKYKTLYIEFENKGYKASAGNTKAAYGYTQYNNINNVYCKGSSGYGFRNYFLDNTSSRTIKSIDISNVTDEFYIAIAQSSAANRDGVYIYNIWLE